MSLRFLIHECTRGFQLRVELSAAEPNRSDENDDRIAIELTIGELLNILERNAKLVGTLEDWTDEATLLADGDDFAGYELFVNSCTFIKSSFSPLTNEDGQWMPSFGQLQLTENN